MKEKGKSGRNSHEDAKIQAGHRTFLQQYCTGFLCFFFAFFLAACATKQDSSENIVQNAQTDQESSQMEQESQADQGSDQAAENLTPSDILALGNWNLQLPIANDAGTSVKIIKSEPLSEGWLQRPYFYVDEVQGGVACYTPVSGKTTENSHYTRTELREVIANNKSCSWNFCGSNSMHLVESVEQVPTSGKIVTGQIHGIYSDGKNGAVPLLVTYDYNNRRLQVSVKLAANDGAKHHVDYFQDVELGQKFETDISCTQGTISVTIKSDGREMTTQTCILTDNSGWQEQLGYFKAGCYLSDSNEDYEGEAGMVELYELSTEHAE